jgi:predicted esterase
LRLTSYYYIPQNVKNTTYLLVEPNNTGSANDDIKVHERRVLNTFQRVKAFADELGVILLVPVFPRPANRGLTYTHALDRDTLLNSTGELARIDLQLIQMIDDLREICRNKGISVNAKVLMDGFSASGNFVNRFTAIHPERVQASVSGGVNCMPILPIDNLKSENLIYPIGVYDIGAITGTPFDLAAYKTVPQYIYMGADDKNDTLPFNDAFSDAERAIIKKVLGDNMHGRWQPSQDVYSSQGCNVVTFVTYPVVGHTITKEMTQDVIDFFKNNIK